MKKKQKITAALVVLGGIFLAIFDVTAMSAPKTKADCLSMAESYEKMAADQEAIVKEHKDMKREYRLSTAISLPKQTREKSIADMEKHCDAIIEAAQALADEYKAVALWHKTHADMMR